ncbi:MAG: hypothetical protein KDD62_07935 [Bdellovibrionales bacterium]|nr:hypothetical protein [Bdellovibrionales bacterium]
MPYFQLFGDSHTLSEHSLAAREIPEALLEELKRMSELRNEDGRLMLRQRDLFVFELLHEADRSLVGLHSDEFQITLQGAHLPSGLELPDLTQFERTIVGLKGCLFIVALEDERTQLTAS